jgi:hypothetical protein
MPFLKIHHFRPLPFCVHLLFHPTLFASSAFLYLFIFTVLPVIPIAVRVRAPIPALLACLWEEEIFLAWAQENFLKFP